MVPEVVHGPWNRGLGVLPVELQRAFQRFVIGEHGRVVAVGNACC
jgi:hypothetical protein